MQNLKQATALRGLSYTTRTRGSSIHSQEQLPSKLTLTEYLHVEHYIKCFYTQFLPKS